MGLKLCIKAYLSILLHIPMYCKYFFRMFVFTKGVYWCSFEKKLTNDTQKNDAQIKLINKYITFLKINIFNKANP